MKILCLLLLVSFQVNAKDEKICNYLKANTFKIHSEKLHDSKDKNLHSLLEKVSQGLDLKREVQCKNGDLWVVKDFDSCALLCIESGSSEVRVKALILTNGIVDLNKETRSCQTLCKSYQQIAFAYEDGSKESSTSPDCRGSVNSSERNNAKAGIFDGALKDHMINSNAVSK